MASRGYWFNPEEETIMMTEWYQKAIDALQLNGLGERTQEAYVRALRMLCEFYHKTPDQIAESELQKYFLHRKNRERRAPGLDRPPSIWIDHSHHHTCQGPLRSVFLPGQGPLFPNPNFALPDVSLAPI
jgi:Phage integrase, N-terminal SAM-like domain